MALRPQFILFGDSITQRSFGDGGWGASLADRYCRKVDVVLRGYGGYNTRWALFLLNQIFPLTSTTPPLVVTIGFGANDAALPGRVREEYHIPLSEYKSNLLHIIHHIKKCSESTIIILVTPPPLDENGRKSYARTLYGENAAELPERTNETTGTYAKACLEIASESNVLAVDLWSKMQEVGGWQQKFLSDGLHLSKDGNSFLYEELIKVLDGKGLEWDKMPYDFPPHSLIDTKDPQKTFCDKDGPAS